MSLCPCCSDKLLFHIGFQRTYWFCPSCWQEMPDLNLVSKDNLTKSFTDFTQENSIQTKSTDITQINV